MNHFLNIPFPFLTLVKVAIFQSAHLSVFQRAVKTNYKSYLEKPTTAPLPFIIDSCLLTTEKSF